MGEGKLLGTETQGQTAWWVKAQGQSLGVEGREGSAVDILWQVESSSGLLGLVVTILMVLKAKKSISLRYGLLRHLACFSGLPHQAQVVKQPASTAVRHYTPLHTLALRMPLMPLLGLRFSLPMFFILQVQPHSCEL